MATEYTCTITCPKCGAVLTFKHKMSDGLTWVQCHTPYCGMRGVRIRHGKVVKVEQ